MSEPALSAKPDMDLDPGMCTPRRRATREVSFMLNGERLEPHLSGGLYWPAMSLLVVSDLHFEKATAGARRGVRLPPYDTASTLAALSRLCAELKPRRVIALGDSFHDGDAPDRLSAAAVAGIRALTAAHDWLWIAGNHDPAPPQGLGGRVADETVIGPLSFRHHPSPGPAAGEVAGHLHPAATVSIRGRRLRRRCFLSDGARAILPAFGAFTGGLDLADKAFDGLFPGPFHAYMQGADRIWPVHSRRLRGFL